MSCSANNHEKGRTESILCWAASLFLSRCLRRAILPSSNALSASVPSLSILSARSPRNEMQSPYASRKHRQLYDEPFTPYTASVRTPRTGRYIPGSAFNSPSYYQSPVSAVPRFAVQQGRPFQRNLQRMSRFFRPQHSPQLPPQQQMFSPLPPLQYAVVMAEPEAVTPFSAATKRAVFYKATSVLCLVLTGFMAMYGMFYGLRAVMYAHAQDIICYRLHFERNWLFLTYPHSELALTVQSIQ